MGSRLKGTASQFVNSLVYNGMLYPHFLKVEVDAFGVVVPVEEKVRWEFLGESIYNKYKAEDEDFQYATLDNFFRLT